MRRPSALVSVVAGPVLILGLFGLGLPRPATHPDRDRDPGRLRAVRATRPAYAAIASDRVDVVGVTPDVETGRGRLRAGAADILVIAPADAQAAALERQPGGDQRRVRHGQPVPGGRSRRTAADQIVAAVNSQLIETAAQRATDLAAAGGPVAGRRAFKPSVIAAPTRLEAERHRPERAEHRGVLRDHGPGADRAAHGHHGQRPVDAPRPPARHVRPVPPVAGRAAATC